MHARLQAEEMLDTALHALAGGGDCHALLDQLPIPLYTTDPQGAVTYWNRACAEFAGRTPELGRDRWCVTWALHTMTGKPLPHAECPMALAIREQRAIRNEIAIAERPDGSRRAFVPYPTPLFDEDGALTGAVNVLVDVTEEQTEVLADQACRCRRLASATYDRQTSAVLDAMASEFERTVAGLRPHPVS
jgi:PAS domain S-box-containing protein